MKTEMLKSFVDETEVEVGTMPDLGTIEVSDVTVWKKDGGVKPGELSDVTVISFSQHKNLAEVVTGWHKTKFVPIDPMKPIVHMSSVCPNCGHAFQNYKGRKFEFCSRDCRDEYRRDHRRAR